MAGGACTQTFDVTKRWWCASKHLSLQKRNESACTHTFDLALFYMHTFHLNVKSALFYIHTFDLALFCVKFAMVTSAPGSYTGRTIFQQGSASSSTLGMERAVVSKQGRTASKQLAIFEWTVNEQWKG